MANCLKITFVSCLLLLVVMDELQPVLATTEEKLKQSAQLFEEGMMELIRRVEALEESLQQSKKARSNLSWSWIWLITIHMYIL